MKMFVVLLALALAGVVAKRTAPDVARYLKMRSM